MPGVFLNEVSAENAVLNFQLIKTVNDLVKLLNWIEQNNEDRNTQEVLKPIEPRHIHFLARTKESRYTHFTIPKKSGDPREIRDPDDALKRVQKLLSCLLQLVFLPKAHYCTNGFLYGRDIIRNAQPHVNKRYILNCDIKDFFPSINFRRVKTVLGLAPFDLKDEKENIAFVIANICVYQNSLPQGAPTSPLLSNIVTQKLDRKLSKYALSRKVKYSRYVDDLTFSSNKNLFDDQFLKDVENIIAEENFQINDKKTRINTDMERQLVTGLLVNEKINIKREYLQKVRAMLNNWEKGGLEFAKRKFRRHQPAHKKDYDFISVVNGHVSFIGNVRGKEDNVFKKIHIQLNMLRNMIDYRFIIHLHVRKRLISDNAKMEKILLDKIHLTDDKFISFCTAAFHQIENILNYYYWRRFPNFGDLIDFLIAKNPGFKKTYKTAEKAKQAINKIKDLKIHVLVYVFEKEFYIEKGGGFYDRRISKLREVRNDASHRCSVIELNKDKVIADHQFLQGKKVKYQAEHNKFMELSTSENQIDFRFSLLEFMDKEDYNYVRKTVKEAVLIVKSDLIKYPVSIKPKAK